MNTSDLRLPVRRLQLDVATRTWVIAPKQALFLRGPIPLDWLARAAKLPGKTLHMAIALWWRKGMARGKPFKLTQTALTAMAVERDAASAGLARLEQAGLIQVDRKPGQRPIVSILDAPAEVNVQPCTAEVMTDSKVITSPAKVPTCSRESWTP